MSPLEQVSLANLMRGAAAERFREALESVAANVMDPETEATATREIVVKVKFKPGDNRHEVATSVSTATKLAPPKALGGTLFMGQRGGEVSIVSQDVQQRDMFTAPPEGVHPINLDKEGTHDA